MDCNYGVALMVEVVCLGILFVGVIVEGFVMLCFQAFVFVGAFVGLCVVCFGRLWVTCLLMVC